MNAWLHTPVRTRREPAADARSGERSRSARPVAILAAAATVVVTGCLAAAPYLALYAEHPSASPVGSDTPTYIWRTRLVASSGVDSLATASPFPFHANTGNADRPGSPTLGSLLSVAGVSPWRFAYLEPALAAAVLALAAGAFGVAALREPMWSFPVFGLAAAWSPQLAVTANGYLDNALVDGVLVAAAAAALAAAAGRRWIAAAIALLVGAWWIHWIFAAFVLTVVAALAVVELPRAIASRRRTPIRRSPAARLAAILGGSLLGSGIATVLAPAVPMMFAEKTRAGYTENLSRQAPYFRIPIFGAAALAGSAALLAEPRDRPPRRRALVFLAIWLLPSIAGWVLYQAGSAIPIQRLLGFALPLPLVGAEALVALLRLGARFARTVGALVGAAVVAAALLWSGTVAWAALERTAPVVEADVLARTQVAMRYLARVAGDRPIVFVADGKKPESDFGGIPAFRRIRMSAPAALVPRIAVYVGTPDELVRDRPSTRPGDPRFDAVSALYWRHLRGVIAHDPIVVAMAPYYSKTAGLVHRGAGTELVEGLAVVRGPAPPASYRTGSPSIVTASTLIGAAARSLLLLLVVGAGWAVATAAGSVIERAGVAPALGVVALVASGIAWSRVGGSLVGGQGVAAVAVATAAGWLAAAVVLGIRRARSRRARTEPVPAER
jgi:hypothetical protein